MEEKILEEIKNIDSTKIEIVCRDGRRIRAYLDKKRDADKQAPLIVISHGYGETKRDYISTSYYLASNGFTVLRYDCLNHLGESDGDIINFTLNDMETSLLTVIKYAKANLGIAGCGVIALSLSSRVAFKVASKEKFVEYIIALTSVINLRDTLMSLYREDLFGKYKDGAVWGTLDILGFEVKDDFLKGAINEKYEDLDSTIADIAKVSVPVCYLVAGDDAWIKYDEVEKAYKNTPNRNSKFITIPGALHQIQENPKLAQATILKMVACCKGYVRSGGRREEPLHKPSIHSIVVQNKIEMTNLKSIFSVTKSDEKKFWVNYLSKFYIIMKSMDYQNMLSLVAQLLGQIDDGCSLLDAGCGNGHFGAWLLCNVDTMMKPGTSQARFKYVGLDFADDALADAKKIHADIIGKMSSDRRKKIKINFEYLLRDLEEGLPCKDNSFDKICCNLVVSYLKDPQKALKDMYLKLKPGGTIVASSLKPYNDLSLVYKSYLDQNVTKEDVLEGRNLLSSAGKIKHKEKQGHYKFFSEKELEQMMKKAGYSEISVYRAFGNQANVAVARK